MGSASTLFFSFQIPLTKDILWWLKFPIPSDKSCLPNLQLKPKSSETFTSFTQVLNELRFRESTDLIHLRVTHFSRSVKTKLQVDKNKYT